MSLLCRRECIFENLVCKHRSWRKARGVTDSYSGCQALWFCFYLKGVWIWIPSKKSWSGKWVIGILLPVEVSWFYGRWVFILLSNTQNSGGVNCVRYCMKRAKISPSYPLNNLRFLFVCFVVFLSSMCLVCANTLLVPLLLYTNLHFPKVLKHFTFDESYMLDVYRD